jgi:ferredoxin-thioredoxin reductase catalytic subunit/rubredoxin
MESDGIEERMRKRYEELNRDAERGGYHLNPDMSFTSGLVRGLIVNADRYGYESCPCRLAFGSMEEDRDIICPCDYRDPDLAEYGACYCGLYVSSDLIRRNEPAPPLPERRPERGKRHMSPVSRPAGNLPYPVWRCRVCGYLCARDQPPDVCPVCKVGHDRFERFM